MMLTLADSRQVAQSLDRCRFEGLNLLEHFLSEGCQFALILSITEDIAGTCVTIIADQPTGTVTTIVTHIVGFVTLWGRCEGFIRKSTVVIQILTKAFFMTRMERPVMEATSKRTRISASSG